MTTALEPITLTAGPYTLRPFEVSDVPLILEAAHDPLIPLITTVPSPSDEQAALAFIQRQHERLRSGQGYSLAIAPPENVAVGQIGLWPQGHERASLGYWITSSRRGEGIASQALRAMTRFAFTGPPHTPLTLERLELYIEPWNEGSWRTAERAGYQREGLLRGYQRVGHEQKNMYMYALLRDEWST